MIDGTGRFEIDEKSMMSIIQEHLNRRTIEPQSLIVTSVALGRERDGRSNFQIGFKGADIPPLTKLIQERGL